MIEHSEIKNLKMVFFEENPDLKIRLLVEL